jgi:hypothetical protein
MDIQAYQRFLAAAAASPKFDAEHLLPAIKDLYAMPPLEEALYRFVLIPGTKLALGKAATENAWMDRNPDWGPGRIDPFNPVKFRLLEQPVDATIGNSDMMPNWNLAGRDGAPLHWDGLNTSVREVVLSSALGDGTPENVLDLRYMDALQGYLEQLQPPPYPLAVDRALADQGRVVFDANCATCHAAKAEHAPILTPIEDPDVDRHRLEMWGAKDAAAYNDKYARYDWRLTHFQDVDRYAATSMQGLWLRGPFLHNGSVPTIADLLAPPDERPAVFFRGNDVLDPVRLGFVSDIDRDPTTGIGFFRYDTRLPGNGNRGHRYGTELSSAEKQALLEFLKTL